MIFFKLRASATKPSFRALHQRACFVERLVERASPVTEEEWLEGNDVTRMFEHLRNAGRFSRPKAGFLRLPFRGLFGRRTRNSTRSTTLRRVTRMA